MRFEPHTVHMECIGVFVRVLMLIAVGTGSRSEGNVGRPLAGAPKRERAS